MSEQNRPIHLTKTSGSQLLQRSLLLVGTGLVLVWLSVGLPQPTWFVLLRTIIQFGTLQSQLGIGLWGPLALLSIQSLLLLAAWCLFIWVAVREVLLLFAPQAARQSSSTITPQSATVQPTVPTQPSANTAAISPQPVVGISPYIMPNPLQPAPATQPFAQSQPISLAPTSNTVRPAARGIAAQSSQGNPFAPQPTATSYQTRPQSLPFQFEPPTPQSSLSGNLPQQTGVFATGNLSQLPSQQKKGLQASIPGADTTPTNRSRASGLRASVKPEIFYQGAVVNNPYEALNPYEKAEMPEQGQLLSSGLQASFEAENTLISQESFKPKRSEKQARPAHLAEEFADPFAVQEDPFQVFLAGDAVDKPAPEERSRPQQATIPVQEHPPQPFRTKNTMNEPAPLERPGQQRAEKPVSQKIQKQIQPEPEAIQAVRPMRQQERAFAHPEPEEEKGGSSSPFLYGNPFDGPLPDVFEHDEELKRAIKEQQQPSQPDASASEGQRQGKRRRRR